MTRLQILFYNQHDVLVKNPSLTDDNIHNNNNNNNNNMTDASYQSPHNNNNDGDSFGCTNSNSLYANMMNRLLLLNTESSTVSVANKAKSSIA